LLTGGRHSDEVGLCALRFGQNGLDDRPCERISVAQVWL
jgi:hypothetical protein